MSHTLHGKFLVESQRSPVYWWPLIFEAMQHHGFSYSSPDYAPGISYYYYRRKDNPSSMDIVTRPFKDLWDEIYGESNEDIMVGLWTSGENYLHLDVGVLQESAHHMLRVNMYFEGTEVMEIPPEQAREILKLVLACATTLYQTCQPCTGEMYWEHAGIAFTPWATFGKPPGAPSADRPMHPGTVGEWRQQVASEEEVEKFKVPGGVLYLLDPVPLPIRKKGWTFISLLEGEGTSMDSASESR